MIELVKPKDKQPDTTDMPGLESQEVELKILAPDQMLSRLPIALAQ